MSRAPESFLIGLRALTSPFSQEDVQAHFSTLRPSTVSVYLSLARKAGYIERVDLKRYRHADAGSTEILPPMIEAVVRCLRAELMPSALQQLVLWGDDSLAPFVHDAFPNPFTVIEGPSKTVATASRVLAREYRTAIVRNHEELGRAIWEECDDPQVFLQVSRRLHSTRLHGHGFRVPALGRVLISVLHMPAILPEAAVRMLRDSKFDIGEAVSALPSRRSTIRFGAFLAWLCLNARDHPLWAKARRLLPEGLEAW